MELQAYLDGELDSVGMAEIDSLIERSIDAQAYVLEASRSTAWLKAEMNAVLAEDIPERLLETINAPTRYQQKVGFPRMLQVAAAIVLLFVGLGSGMLLDRGEQAIPYGMVGYIPASFTPVIEDALENSLRRTSKEWQADTGDLAVTVTPTMTYKDNSGTYYREYHLDLRIGEERRQINGLAYRTSEGQWKTSALYFNENNNLI